MHVDIKTYDYGPGTDMPVAAPSNVTGSYLIPHMYGSRFLVFIPRFTQVPAPGQRPSDNAKSGKPGQVNNTWSIQLSWSEIKGGSWSPAKLLPAAGIDGKQSFFPDSSWSLPPNVGMYGFSTNTPYPETPELVVVAVTRQSKLDSNTRIIGQFWVVCSQMTAFSSFLTHDASLETISNIPTCDFQIVRDTGVVLRSMLSPDETSRSGLLIELKNGPTANSSQSKMQAPQRKPSLLYKGISINLFHGFAHELLDSALDPNTTFADTIVSVSSKGTDLDLGEIPNHGGVEYDASFQYYSAYNWELGLFVPMLVVESLLSSQQFDDALTVIRSIFDPRVLTPYPDPSNWKFRPFFQDQKTAKSSALFDIVDLTHQQDTAFDPFLIARERPQRFMIWVALKYVQILIAYGDYYFRMNTLESISEAIQYYVEASHIYGSRQEVYKAVTTTESKTYNTIVPTFSLAGSTISAFLADMECYSPYQANNTMKEKLWLAGDTMSCSYFCMPSNSVQLAVRDTIDDRHFKLRNSLDINGNVRLLPLFEAPIDPGKLIQAAVAGSLTASNVLNDLNAPLVNLRFNRLMQKALDTCYDLRTFWSNLLNAKISKDQAILAQLLARQNTQTQNLAAALKTMTLEQAKATLEALEYNREGVVDRMTHFLRLVGEKGNDLIPPKDKEFTPLAYGVPQPVDSEDLIFQDEADAERFKDAGTGLMSVSLAATTVSAVLAMLPKLRFHEHPFGGGASQEIGGDEFARAQEKTAEMFQKLGEIMDRTAEKKMQRAERVQRLAERKLEVNDLGYAIKAIDKQVAIQQMLVEMTSKDIENQKTSMAMAQEVEKCLANQHMNLDMLTWLEASLQKVYYETYTIVYDLAKKAEKAYRFELGIDKTAPDIIDGAFWDMAHDGAYAGEKLYNALKRLQTAYDETQGFDFEIKKSISLRQLDPLSLFRLRSTGSCEFAVKEIVLDLDFAGHIKRRLKTSSIRLQGVTADSIAGTLTLMSHQYRVNDADDTTQSDNIAIKSIAVSTPSGDNGTSLDFSSDSFLPFEGAGADSTWSFDLSPFSALDPANISDLILDLKYTSKAGNTVFRESRIAAVLKFLSQAGSIGNSPAGPFAALDLSLDFPRERWQEFSKSADIGLRKFSLIELMDRFPFYAQAANSKTMASRVTACYIVMNDSASGTVPELRLDLSSGNVSNDDKDYLTFLPNGLAEDGSSVKLMSVNLDNKTLKIQDIAKSSLTMSNFKGELKPLVLVLQWTAT